MSKRQFKAESKRLLDLMIHSIYTHKDIFLREIISNASDAIDKLAYRALTDDKVGLNREDFKITVALDRDARSITIADNGIGMTKDQLSDNLGVIAKSGSLAFRQEASQQDDIDIIGQFGVGFYSAFMVASKVEVSSRAYGEEEAYCFSSTGADGYTISPCTKETVGTNVRIFLREDTAEEGYSDYLEAGKIRQIIKKYSDYIRYPIILEEETINSMVPIWQKTDASLEDCFAFYKEKFHDFHDPLAVQKVFAEGTAVSYRAMLFYPAKTPYNYYTKDFPAGLTLYTAGVMILEHSPELLPEHFRFVRGVVDSADLSLNISREMLQQDRQVKTIASSLEKKIKSELKRMLDHERAQYETLFSQFGLGLKYGVVQEYGAKADFLRDLLLFYSAKEEKLISLAQYVENMGEGQQYIYYAAGETKEKIALKPQLGAVLESGWDVLYLTDEVDEFVVQILAGQDEKSFLSIYAEDLGLPEAQEKKEATRALEESHKNLLDFAKEALGETLAGVRLNPHLKQHPAALTSQGEISFEMEKYFQSRGQEAGMPPLKAERVLELNPEHPAFCRLQKAYEDTPEKAKEYVALFYNQALLLADLPLDNLGEYVDLVWRLLD